MSAEEEPTMELDELKTAWRELDRRVVAIDLHQKRELRERKLSTLRTLLRLVGAVLLFELLCDVFAVVLTGSFAVEHWREARFVIPALVLHLAAIASIGSCVYQLAWIGRIDFAEPVVGIQRRLARLRVARIRTLQWTLLLSPLLWMPLVIVGARGFLGLDLYAGLGMPYIAANFAFGILVIPLGIWAARACADRLGDSPMLKSLADSVAGRSLVRAQLLVREVEVFEQER
jgi:hypothetical protein